MTSPLKGGYVLSCFIYFSFQTLLLFVWSTDCINADPSPLRNACRTESMFSSSSSAISLTDIPSIVPFNRLIILALIGTTLERLLFCVAKVIGSNVTFGSLDCISSVIIRTPIGSTILQLLDFLLMIAKSV